MTKPQNYLSLQVKFVLMLLIALTLASGIGALTYLGGNAAIEHIYLSEEAEAARCQKVLDDFQTYVRTYGISVRQAREISRWAKSQNYVYLLIRDGEEVVVDSGWWDENDYYTVFDEADEAQSEEAATDSEADAAAGDGYESDWTDEANGRMIRFADGVYLVTVYDFSETPLYSVVVIATFALAIAFFLVLMLIYHQRVIKQIIKLSREVEEIAHGSLNGPITVKDRDEIGVLAEHVDVMRTSIMTQMRAEQEAWNANSDLITRMSHDIRTPLTVLLGFLELLDEGGYSDDESYQSYLGICKENAYQLKELADKLFQYFLVFGHKMYELKPEIVDARMLLGQLIGEHEMLLLEQGWQIENEPLEQSVQIRVDAVYFKRLFDNLFSNIEKYADRSRPVRIKQRLEHEQIHIMIENHIRPNPNPVESTNIGLKTCERIVELMDGSFRTEEGKTQFLAELWMPVYREQENVPEKKGITGRLPILPGAKTDGER